MRAAKTSWLIVPLSLCLAAVAVHPSAQAAPPADASGTLQTQVAVLQTQVSALSTRVAALEGQSAPGQGNGPAPTAPGSAASIGQTMTYLHWRLTVLGVDSRHEITAPGAGLVANGIWRIVTVRIENAGRTEPFPFADLLLMAKDKTAYEPDLLDMDRIANDNHALQTDQALLPGRSYQFTLFYDVPTDAAGLSLVSTDQSIAVDLGI